MLSECMAINCVKKTDPQKAQALADKVIKDKASTVDFAVDSKILVETSKTE